MVLNDNRYDNGVVAPFYLQCTLLLPMEDGGVDTTVIDRWQHKMSQLADYPPHLASSILDFYKQETPKIESQAMQDTLMNLVNTILFKEYVNPLFKMSIYSSVLNSCVYISLYPCFYLFYSSINTMNESSCIIRFCFNCK